jgi:hypothetical protein
MLATAGAVSFRGSFTALLQVSPGRAYSGVDFALANLVQAFFFGFLPQFGDNLGEFLEGMFAAFVLTVNDHGTRFPHLQ